MFRVIALALLFLSGAAMAHEPDNKPDLGWRGPGSSFDPATTASDDAIKMNLAVDGQTIKLFVTDSDGNPVDIDIAEAKAFISSAGKTSWFSLRPVGMNVLSGEGESTLPCGYPAADRSTRISDPLNNRASSAFKLLPQVRSAGRT